jgi:hypothetical protein
MQGYGDLLARDHVVDLETLKRYAPNTMFVKMLMTRLEQYQVKASARSRMEYRWRKRCDGRCKLSAHYKPSLDSGCTACHRGSRIV